MRNAQAGGRVRAKRTRRGAGTAGRAAAAPAHYRLFPLCSTCATTGPMVRFGMEQLRDKALAALEEACEESRSGPVRRTMALRFALAFLANFERQERWPFDHFWQAVGDPRDIGRWQNANASLNAIYRLLGLTRPDTPASADRGLLQPQPPR